MLNTLFIIAWIIQLFWCINSKIVTISNKIPRQDLNGNIIDAHDGTIIQWKPNGDFFYYSMSYGLCQEPSGTNKSNGCAAMQGNMCGFEYNQSINLYTSNNLTVWQYHGTVLPLTARPHGVYFSPSIAFNPNTNLYILYANYLPNATTFSTGGYMAASSESPYGPFSVINDYVNLTNGQPGDSKLFVDDDNNGYLIYTSGKLKPHGIVVELLTKDFKYSTGIKSKVFNFTVGLEAPCLIKHFKNGLYYAFTSYDCCYCENGGDVVVWMSHNVLGPYQQTIPYINDKNGNGNNKNLVINAQETDVFMVPIVDSNGIKSYEYIWVGDRWQSSPNGAKGYDFTAWAPLKWNNDSSIEIMKWYDNFTINLDMS
eukprot:197137_1